MDIPQKAWKWRMQTWLVLIVGLVAILVALVASFASSSFRPATEVKVGQSGYYTMWRADTDSELYQGLSGVDKLARNGGLLMDFKVPGYHGIVMRGMNFPLDIVWLDEGKKVVHIVTGANPEVDELKEYIPLKQARYVLELPSGSVKNSAIRIGGVAEFENVGDI